MNSLSFWRLRPWSLDHQGRVAAWSAGCEALTGVSPEMACKLLWIHLPFQIRSDPPEPQGEGRLVSTWRTAAGDHTTIQWQFRSAPGDRKILVGAGAESNHDGGHSSMDAWPGAALLLDRAPIGIARVDLDGQLIDTNTALVSMLGYNAAELRTKSCVKLVHPEDQAEAYRLCKEVSSGQRDHFEIEERLVRKEGSSFWARVSVSLVRSRTGDPLFSIGLVQDISAERAREEEKKQADRMETLGQLASVVAHDFNNLLAVLQACHYKLQMAPDLSNEARIALQAAEKARENGAALARQITSFGRPLQKSAERLDLNEYVSQQREMLQQAAGEKVRLELTTHQEALPVCIESDTFSQALLNLVNNAKQAMPRGGEISISLEHAAHEAGRSGIARLTVRDTGTGIAPEILPRIWDPFFTTREKSGGSGLGLASVRSTIRRLGGDIQCSSRPGEGSIFTIELPLA